MYDHQTVLRVSADTLMRYEPHLDGGLVFLFHADRGTISTGNADVQRFLSYLDGCRTLGDICGQILAEDPELPPQLIAEGVARTAEQLLAGGFLEAVS